MKNIFFFCCTLLLLLGAGSAEAQTFTRSYGTAAVGENLKNAIRVGNIYYVLGNSGTSLMLSAIDVTTGVVNYTKVYPTIPATAASLVQHNATTLLLSAHTYKSGGNSVANNFIYTAIVNITDGSIAAGTTVNTISFNSITVNNPTALLPTNPLTYNVGIRYLLSMVPTTNGEYIIGATLNEGSGTGISVDETKDRILLFRYNPTTNTVVWNRTLDNIFGGNTACRDFELRDLTSDGANGAVFIAGTIGVTYTGGDLGGNYPIVVGRVDATGAVTTRHLSNNAIFPLSIKNNGLAGTARRYIIAGTRSRSTDGSNSGTGCTFTTNALPDATVLIELNDNLSTILRAQSFSTTANSSPLTLAPAAAYYTGADAFAVAGRIVPRNNTGTAGTLEGFTTFNLAAPALVAGTVGVFSTGPVSPRVILANTPINGATQSVFIQNSFYDATANRIGFLGYTGQALTPTVNPTINEALITTAAINNAADCLNSGGTTQLTVNQETYANVAFNARIGAATSAVATVASTVTPLTTVNNTICGAACIVPPITGTAAICAGASSILTASGGGTYVWNNLATTAAITVTPTATTTYTATVTTAAGCTGSVNYTVTVNPKPVLALSFQPLICQGSTTGISVSGATTYVWSTTGTGSSILVATTAAATTTYTVTGTGTGGCTATVSQAITVLPRPTPSISTVCLSGVMQATATGGQTYLWSNGATTPIISVTSANQGTFTVTATAANTCAQIAVATLAPPSCNGLYPNATVVQPTGVTTGATVYPTDASASITHKWALWEIQNGVRVQIFPATGYVTTTNFVIPTGTMVFGHIYIVEHIAMKYCCESAADLCTTITPQCPDAAFAAPVVCTRQTIYPNNPNIYYESTVTATPSAATLGAGYVHDFEVYSINIGVIPTVTTLIASAYGQTYLSGGAGFTARFNFSSGSEAGYKICHKVRYTGTASTSCTASACMNIVPDVTNFPDGSYIKNTGNISSTPNTPYSITCTASINPVGSTHKWAVRKITNSLLGPVIDSSASNIFTSSVYLSGTTNEYLILHTIILNGCQGSTVSTESQNRPVPTTITGTQRGANPHNNMPSTIEANLETESSLFVSPNPTLGDLNVQYNLIGDKTGETTLTVIDVLGRQIVVNKLQNDNGSLVLPTKEWAAGFYQITVQNGENRLTKKVSVVKQ